MNASYGLSAALLSIIYRYSFSNGFVTSHEDRQNVSGFFLLLAASFACVGAISIFGMREYYFEDPNTLRNVQSYQVHL